MVKKDLLATSVLIAGRCKRLLWQGAPDITKESDGFHNHSTQLTMIRSVRSV